MGLGFGKKITLKSFLNNVKKSEIGLELGSKVEKMMSSILEVNKLAYLEHISAFSILLAYDRLECPVAPLSGASRPPRGLG